MLYRYSFVCWIVFCCVLLVSSFSMAVQQQTATISALNKDVFISFQDETPVPAIAGTLMRQGDSLRTYSGADAMLNLSDGSKLQLKENTNLSIITMTKDPVSASSFELLWGRVRAVLSPLYKNPDSAFAVQTPNALVNVSASELDVEIVYEPATKTTTVLAHEFDLEVTNVVTGVSLHLPQGHSAIIYEGIIQEIAGIIDVALSPKAQEQSATITSLQGEVFVSFQGAVSTSAINGTVLRAGDEIYTDANATAVLEFADGTKLELGEDTNINIFKLAKDTRGVWITRLKLFRGDLRTILGEGFRAANSSFIVQTANVRAAIKPAENMDAEMIYDPNTSITTLMAHQSALAITHLLTEISATIPEQQSGIIYNHVIQQVDRILKPLQEATPSQPETTKPATEEPSQPETTTTTP